MSERLEEIKEIHEQADAAYHENNFKQMQELINTLFLEEFTDWLIEQAERVEVLDNENSQLHRKAQNLRKDSSEWYKIASRLQDEIQRYKQALGEISRWDKMLYSPNEMGNIARKALKGDS